MRIWQAKKVLNIINLLAPRNCYSSNWKCEYAFAVLGCYAIARCPCILHAFMLLLCREGGWCQKASRFCCGVVGGGADDDSSVRCRQHAHVGCYVCVCVRVLSPRIRRRHVAAETCVYNFDQQLNYYFMYKKLIKWQISMFNVSYFMLHSKKKVVDNARRLHAV